MRLVLSPLKILFFVRLVLLHVSKLVCVDTSDGTAAYIVEYKSIQC